MKKLLQGIDRITKPVCGRIVYRTPFEVLQKSRKDKTIKTPDRLQGIDRIINRVVNIGNEYTTAVERQISKGGGNPEEWWTDKHSWAEAHPDYKSGNVYRSVKNPDQIYIKIFEDMSSSICDAGFVKGDTLVTVTWDDQVQFCKKNPEQSGSVKQEMHDVAKEVKFRLVKIENVKYIKCGEFVYDNLTSTERALLEEIKEAA